MKVYQRFFLFSLSMAIVSALLVGLPGTGTLLDAWRLIASIVTGAVAAFSLITTLIFIND